MKQKFIHETSYVYTDVMNYTNSNIWFHYGNIRQGIYRWDICPNTFRIFKFPVLENYILFAHTNMSSFTASKKINSRLC